MFVQRFVLVSLSATVLVGVVFGALAVRAVEGFVLSQYARTTAAYVSEFLTHRLVAKDFLLRPSTQRVQFEFAIREVAGKTGILRVTVWNPRGQVLYSGDRDLFERPPSLSAPLHAALGGRIQSLLVPAPPGGQRRMEVFIPVVLPGATNPVGVYDVLFSLKDLEPALDRLRWSVWASAIFGVLVLYAALFAIVRRASHDLTQQHQTLQLAFAGIVQSLSKAIDARDMATADHSDRVAELAVAIASIMGVDQTGARDIQIAAFLHDVGKIGIHDDILVKHGPLTKQERVTMQRHAVLGFEILQPVPISEQVKLAVRHHHEWWDGTGYPDGLAGDDIPLAARVIAVADAYMALTTDRPYRRALDPTEAVEDVRRSAGSQFDPKVVAAFLRVVQESPHPAARQSAAFSADIAFGA